MEQVDKIMHHDGDDSGSEDGHSNYELSHDEDCDNSGEGECLQGQYSDPEYSNKEYSDDDDFSDEDRGPIHSKDHKLSDAIGAAPNHSQKKKTRGGTRSGVGEGGLESHFNEEEVRRIIENIAAGFSDLDGIPPISAEAWRTAELYLHETERVVLQHLFEVHDEEVTRGAKQRNLRPSKSSSCVMSVDPEGNKDVCLFKHYSGLIVRQGICQYYPVDEDPQADGDKVVDSVGSKLHLCETFRRWLVELYEKLHKLAISSKSTVGIFFFDYCMLVKHFTYGSHTGDLPDDFIWNAKLSAELLHKVMTSIPRLDLVVASSAVAKDLGKRSTDPDYFWNKKGEAASEDVAKVDSFSEIEMVTKTYVMPDSHQEIIIHNHMSAIESTAVATSNSFTRTRSLTRHISDENMRETVRKDLLNEKALLAVSSVFQKLYQESSPSLAMLMREYVMHETGVRRVVQEVIGEVRFQSAFIGCVGKISSREFTMKMHLKSLLRTETSSAEATLARAYSILERDSEVGSDLDSEEDSVLKTVLYHYTDRADGPTARTLGDSLLKDGMMVCSGAHIRHAMTTLSRLFSKILGGVLGGAHGVGQAVEIETIHLPAARAALDALAEDALATVRAKYVAEVGRLEELAKWNRELSERKGHPGKETESNVFLKVVINGIEEKDYGDRHMQKWPNHTGFIYKHRICGARNVEGAIIHFDTEATIGSALEVEENLRAGDLGFKQSRLLGGKIIADCWYLPRGSQPPSEEEEANARRLAPALSVRVRRKARERPPEESGTRRSATNDATSEDAQGTHADLQDAETLTTPSKKSASTTSYTIEVSERECSCRRAKCGHIAIGAVKFSTILTNKDGKSRVHHNYCLALGCVNRTLLYSMLAAHNIDADTGLEDAPGMAQLPDATRAAAVACLEAIRDELTELDASTRELLQGSNYAAPGETAADAPKPKKKRAKADEGEGKKGQKKKTKKADTTTSTTAPDGVKSSAAIHDGEDVIRGSGSGPGKRRASLAITGVGALRPPATKDVAAGLMTIQEPMSMAQELIDQNTAQGFSAMDTGIDFYPTPLMNGLPGAYGSSSCLSSPVLDTIAMSDAGSACAASYLPERVTMKEAEAPVTIDTLAQSIADSIEEGNVTARPPLIESTIYAAPVSLGANHPFVSVVALQPISNGVQATLPTLSDKTQDKDTMEVDRLVNGEGAKSAIAAMPAVSDHEVRSTSTYASAIGTGGAGRGEEGGGETLCADTGSAAQTEGTRKRKTDSVGEQVTRAPIQSYRLWSPIPYDPTVESRQMQNKGILPPAPSSSIVPVTTAPVALHGSDGDEEAVRRQRRRLHSLNSKAREVQYECSACEESYTWTMKCNPWWAIDRHECPKCQRMQTPRLDIEVSVNSIPRHHAQLLGVCMEQDNDDSDSAIDGSDTEEELGEDQLEPSQAAKLLVLMEHARECPGRHADPRHAEVCRSTKFLMLHIRDCSGYSPRMPGAAPDAPQQPCAHQWCKPCRHLLQHLVQCVNPSSCAICNPVDLPASLRHLRDLTSRLTQVSTEGTEGKVSSTNSTISG